MRQLMLIPIFVFLAASVTAAQPQVYWTHVASAECGNR
jgi:hypothetical protein